MIFKATRPGSLQKCISVLSRLQWLLVTKWLRHAVHIYVLHSSPNIMVWLNSKWCCVRDTVHSLYRMQEPTFHCLRSVIYRDCEAVCNSANVSLRLVEGVTREHSTPASSVTHTHLHTHTHSLNLALLAFASAVIASLITRSQEQTGN